MRNFILLKLAELKCDHYPTVLVLSTIEHYLNQPNKKGSYEFLDSFLGQEEWYEENPTSKRLDRNFIKRLGKSIHLPDMTIKFGEFKVVRVGYNRKYNNVRLDFIWKDDAVYSNHISLESDKLKQIRFHHKGNVIFLRS